MRLAFRAGAHDEAGSYARAVSEIHRALGHELSQLRDRLLHREEHRATLRTGRSMLAYSGAELRRNSVERNGGQLLKGFLVSQIVH
jgi:hypothetical protein